MMKILCLVACLAIFTSASQRPGPAKIPEVSAVYDKDWFSGYLDFPFQKFNADMHYFYFPSQSANP